MPQQKLSAEAGRYIKQLVVAQGKSGAWLAEKVGVVPTTVSKWVNGRQGISGGNLAKIAEALGTTVEDILRHGSPPELMLLRETSPRVRAITERNPAGIRRFDLHVGLGSRIAMAIDDARDHDFTREELLDLLDEIRAWGEEAERTINNIYKELRRLSRTQGEPGDS